MNIIILACEIVVVFSMVLVFNKLFKANGLITWVCLATIIANITTMKNADIGGLNVAIGTVMFASTFLATDILTEYYSKELARKAVYMGVCSIVVFIVSTQIALIYKPSAVDWSDGFLHSLFSVNLRISISSAVMYFIANLVDVSLFSKIKQKTNGEKLWLRNNVSTILCNCLENFFFMFFAFVGLYPLSVILSMAVSTSIIEGVVAICDTPFLYAAQNEDVKNVKRG